MSTLVSKWTNEGLGYRDMKRFRTSPKTGKPVANFKDLNGGSWVQYLFTFYTKSQAEAWKGWYIDHSANHVRVYPVGPESRKHYELWVND